MVFGAGVPYRRVGQISQADKRLITKPQPDPLPLHHSCFVPKSAGLIT